MRLHALRLTALPALLAACQSPDRPVASTRVVRDTVGDTIVVRNSGPGAWGDSVRLVEELRIGDPEGGDDYGFAFVAGIAVDSAGTMAVADPTMKSVRLYDADGRFLRQVGHDGSGPGEYRSPASLAYLPDGRLLVRDAGNRRVIVYARDGAPLDAFPLGSGLSARWSLVVDTGGRINALVIGRTGSGWPHMGYRRMDGAGVVLDTLFEPRRGDEVRNPAPYEPTASWSLHPTGGYVGGLNDRYALHLLRPDGRVLRIERTDVAALPVSDAERAALEEERQDALLRSRERHLAQPFRPIPDVKPAFHYVRAADDGRIWVLTHQPSLERPADPTDTRPISERPSRWYEPTAYDVFEADGTFLARVPFPPRALPHVMQGEHVWGVTRDSLDVPYVVRWRLQRATP
jgi:hypothetical protein